jgi:hypothetical protein
MLKGKKQEEKANALATAEERMAEEKREAKEKQKQLDDWMRNPTYDDDNEVL